MTVPAVGLLVGIVSALPVEAQPRPRPGLAGPRAAGRPNKKALDRFRQMSPEQRRQALKNLPPERRRAIQERLERYDRLPPEERKRLERQLDDFREWSPERQQAARRVFQRVNQIPPERRHVIRREFQSWDDLSDDEIRTRMNSEEFRGRYSPDEREILQEMAKLKSAP